METTEKNISESRRRKLSVKRKFLRREIEPLRKRKEKRGSWRGACGSRETGRGRGGEKNDISNLSHVSSFKPKQYTNIKM